MSARGRVTSELIRNSLVMRAPLYYIFSIIDVGVAVYNRNLMKTKDMHSVIGCGTTSERPRFWPLLLNR